MKSNIKYPALYYAADQASNNAQIYDIWCYKAYSSLLVVGAALALVNKVTPVVAIGSALCFIASLAIYVYSQIKDYRRHWYQARALAESIKTSTWRLIMYADPFSQQNVSENLKKYKLLLSELLKENSSIGPFLADVSVLQEQLPVEIKDLILIQYQDKREFYLKNRIKEQKDWYVKKAKENKRNSIRYFWVIVTVYSAVILLLLARINCPDMKLVPIDLLTLVASLLIGWKQLCRYEELSSSYALTANEVEIIGSCFDSVSSQAELSDFVSDAENAFSREHTQWAARRSH